MPTWLVPSWSDVWIAMTTAVGIMFVVVFVARVAGLRTFAKMSAFDFASTVAMGSIVASTIVLRGTTLMEGAFSIMLLLLLQLALTFANRRFQWVRTVLKATPQLLFFDGHFLEDNMRGERIIRAEVYAAIRQQGYKSMEDIYAVVLETNSQLSVIPNENDDVPGFSLADVGGLPEGLREDLEKRGEEDDQPNSD